MNYQSFLLACLLKKIRDRSYSFQRNYQEWASYDHPLRQQFFFLFLFDSFSHHAFFGAFLNYLGIFIINSLVTEQNPAGTRIFHPQRATLVHSNFIYHPLHLSGFLVYFCEIEINFDSFEWYSETAGLLG